MSEGIRTLNTLAQKGKEINTDQLKCTSRGYHKVTLIFQSFFFLLLKVTCIFLCTEMSSHDENNTAKIIDQMFEEVLEYADRMDEEREENDDYTADHDGSIGACSADRDKLDTEPEEEREKNEQECEKIMKIEDIEDELLTFPPSGILSPLSKSVEAVVTPLVRPNRTASCYHL